MPLRTRLRLCLGIFAATAAVNGPAFAIEPADLDAAPDAATRFAATRLFAAEPPPAGPGPRVRSPSELPASLGFYERPGWIRAVERAAKRGLTLARLRKGRDTNFVFGVDQHGYIGFYMVPKD